MRRLAILFLPLALTSHARTIDDTHKVTAALVGRVWHDETPLADGSFEMTCVIDELDARGAVTKHVVLEHRRTFHSGSMREELISARENDVDILERQRRAEAHPVRLGTGDRWSLDDALAPPIPFLGESPYHYQLVLQTASDTAGAGRMTYAPHERRADRRCASGHIELDAHDGLPLSHRFTPIPLPKMIRALTTTVQYGRVNGLAVPVSTESIGEGGLFFIKKRFRVRMTYHHWNLNTVASAIRLPTPTVSDNSNP